MLPFKLTGPLQPFGQLAALPPHQGNISHPLLDHYRSQLLQDYTARLRLMMPSHANQPPSGMYPNAAATSSWAAYLAYASRQHDPRLLRLDDTRFLRLGLPHEEPKPSQSYIGLIAMAILSSKEKKLVLSDIYQWILDHYPYFRSRGPGWRNSIRHNLSLNDCFIKCGRSANGKGHYWAVHPANVDDFQRGDFRRRRAQRKVRKAMGMIVPDDEDDDDSPPPSLLHAPSASSSSLWSSNRPYTPSSHLSPQSQLRQSHSPSISLTSPSPSHWPEDSSVSCSGEQPRQGSMNQSISIDIDNDNVEDITGGKREPTDDKYLKGVNASTSVAAAAAAAISSQSSLPAVSGFKRRLFDMESLLAPDVARESKLAMRSSVRTGAGAEAVNICCDDSNANQAIKQQQQSQQKSLAPFDHHHLAVSSSLREQSPQNKLPNKQSDVSFNDLPSRDISHFVIR